MVVGSVMAVRHCAPRLSAQDAIRIAEQVRGFARARVVLIDLRRTTEATTAALARLILLRKRLLAKGRDLRIRGLCGRADALYRMTRMERLLPRRGPGRSGRPVAAGTAQPSRTARFRPSAPAAAAAGEAAREV